MAAHNSGASYTLLQLSVYIVKVIEKKDAGVVRPVSPAPARRITGERSACSSEGKGSATVETP